MAADEHADFLPSDVCPALRTKTMLLNTVYRTSDFERRSASDVAVFHCGRTMAPYGPDEDDVTPDACRPGRSCWCGDPT